METVSENPNVLDVPTLNEDWNTLFSIVLYVYYLEHISSSCCDSSLERPKPQTHISLELQVSEIENLLASFVDANKKLDAIQKGNGDQTDSI